MNCWVVKIVHQSDFYSEWWIRRVIDYKKKRFNYAPWKESAHKYKSEKAARKAADAFNGFVEVG